VNKAIPVILFLAFFSFPQEIVKNQEKPLAQNAGRIVDLEEVLTIEDTGDDYYFKYPSNLKIAPDGSIFVTDWFSGLLARFDKEGKFLRNYFRKGEGPGELSSIGDYFFEEDNIVIHDSSLQKILWLGFGGEIVKEFKVLRTARAFDFVLCHNDTYYFIKYNVPYESTKPAYVDIPYQLVSVDKEGIEADPLMCFQLNSHVVASGGGGGGYFPIDEMITAPFANRYLLLSHTQEYLLKVFDAEANQIIHSFTRDYKRVKPTSEYKELMKKGVMVIGGKRYTKPPQKYRNDIQNLFVDQNKFWVMTSTEDKKKGILFDVFDLEGTYVDQFYLKFTEENFPLYGGRDRMAISGEFLYQIESTPEDTYVIKKYKMVNFEWPLNSNMSKKEKEEAARFPRRKVPAQDAGSPHRGRQRTFPSLSRQTATKNSTG
jgi:hypothetical protein